MVVFVCSNHDFFFAASLTNLAYGLRVQVRGSEALIICRHSLSFIFSLYMSISVSFWMVTLASHKNESLPCSFQRFAGIIVGEVIVCTSIGEDRSVGVVEDLE